MSVTVEHLPRDRGRQPQVLFVREQLTEKGHIDGMFASAGVGNLMEPFGTVTAESFDATFICQCSRHAVHCAKSIGVFGRSRVNHTKRRGGERR
jgi:hypothetical protein